MVPRIPPHWTRSLPRSTSLAAFALLAFAGCASTDQVTAVHEHLTNAEALEARGDAPVSPETKSQTEALRAMAPAWRKLAAAKSAGFDTQVSPCVASPEGGMGFHWANPSRIDATVVWDQPEIMVFVPQGEGVTLGAAEYVVPIALSATPPVLFGQTFIPGGPDNSLWTLHVWLGISNPSGIYAPWNPRVTCP